MRTIWKFGISSKLDKETISFPYLMAGGSARDQVLHVAAQFGEIVIWVMVDTDYASRNVDVKIRNTGSDCNDLLPEDHIGTVLQNNGWQVTHLFMEE